MGRVGQVSWDLSYLPRHAFYHARDWVASHEESLIPTRVSTTWLRVFAVMTTWTFFGWTITRISRR